MQIAKDTVVSIDYTLRNPAGDVLDSSEGRAPLAYLHGAGGIIPGLEWALDGKGVGDELMVTVAPEDGYGEVDDSLIQDVPRGMFKGVPTLEPGMQFQARGPDGVRIVTVVEVGDEAVKVDANHPLAGVTLSFAVTVRDVRAATDEELEHGHVHGPGGHHH